MIQELTDPSAEQFSHHETLATDTIDHCSRLIRFDTSNYGGGDSRGEREAAEWVAEVLADAGYAPQVLESEPRRASTVVRIPGADALAPALLVHGHLDVVPAEPSDWSFDPFSGEVTDGAVRGRGALDMKDMDAMMLACATGFARTGTRPPRDIVMAFVADEEDTGAYGAGFLVDKHPGLFEGVTAAISESGGYSVHLPNGRRLYPVATGERGSAWMTLSAHGAAGHGSRRNPDNAVATLVRTVAELAAHTWPVHLIPPVRALLDGLGSELGITIDPADPASVAQLGEAARLVESTMSNSLNPTRLNAGYKHNVIPSEATAGIDGRVLPGAEKEFFAAVDAVLGTKVTREFASWTEPVAADHTSPEFAAMADALRAHDPQALVLPFCMSGGTDAKAFARLGIAGYGFAPGTTPPGFNSWDYVHGVDEHVLTDSLAFGVRVLDTFLRADPSSPASD
ncbi:M20/M25/M40 family metallo-hydrolase [Streptomyces sp. NBC_01717]|uniref:M20/M25/M40 family metallo-hydrolase n=1 Tax=Streptomyces sp. NBC_01717 TaxID=2975918 RepID=UPI002E36769C|nr:M20/M25/M40 family metallo-hydrolase [Streptomyces sp. NBC_01717]